MIAALIQTQGIGQKIAQNFQPLPISSNSANSQKSLTDLLKESQNILFRFHTVFPFDLFPDEVTIDENKVNIVKKRFYFSYSVHSVLISDITDISLETGPFFASLTIIDSSNYRFPIEIKISNITKENAYTARKIIQGMIATKRNNISLASLPINKVRNDVSILGETRIKEIKGV